MSDYEILMIVLGMISLLISTGVLLVALLSFLDKRKRKRK